MLDPDVDYSKSGQYKKFNTKWNHRWVDIKFWTAPEGFCRWCGEDLAIFRKDGKRNTAIRWHASCSDSYLSTAPAAQRARIFKRDKGICRSCGVQLLKGRRQGDWQCDHVVALINGGSQTDENLQLLCGKCHNVKTAREAGERAEVRKKQIVLVKPLDEWFD